MNGKERMKIAMTGGKPDRVPFNPQIVFTHAVRQLEKKEDYEKCIVKCYEDPEYFADLAFEISRTYHADGFRIMPLQSDTLKIKKEINDYIAYETATGERLGCLDMTTGNIIEDDPVHIKCMEDVKKIKIPSPQDFYESIEIQRAIKCCDMAKDDFFKIGWVTMPGDYLISQRGMSQSMIDLIDDEDLVKALSETCVEIAINKAKAYAKTEVDGLLVGDAGASSSLISPAHFKEFVFPYIKRFCEAIRPTGLILYLHICGCVRPIVEMMAETGVHCLEPMDALGGMKPYEFREKVGNKVALMGGVNTVTLASGNPEDVEREARECIEGAGKNGGYIMAAGDMVPFEAPRENVLKMYEVASSYFY
jgi:MtaA/CmuA family methyltransferase